MLRILALSFLIVLCHFHISIATIRNGYAGRASEIETALFNLCRALESGNSMSSYERKSIKGRIQKMVLYLACFDATDRLMSQFRRISPELYNQIDSLKDAQGRSVDVFVKIILKDHATIMAAGLTRMAAVEDDPDGCTSEYGRQTASVQIWAVANSLIILAHEMGHVAYQVPNFAHYLSYYRSKYHHREIQDGCMGHEPDDYGGKMAQLFERKFNKDRALRLSLVEARTLDSPTVLILDAQNRISSTVFARGKRSRIQLAH